MEDILKELYDTYRQLLNDLSIGHPLNDESLKRLWILIHRLHFVRYEDYANSEIVKLLEYYEYLQ
jgi:hypothetical protein